MLKRRKTIENGIIYDGNIPYSKQADSGKIAEVNARGEWELKEASSLPSVTSADNGKLLGVTDGAWGKVDAPSGGGTEIFNVVFTASWNEQYIMVITSSKTAAEILAAQQAGKYITANYRTADSDEGTRAISILVQADYDDSPYCVVRFLTHHAEQSSATSNDMMEFTKIYWDSGQNDWFGNSYFYSLSPAE